MNVRLGNPAITRLTDSTFYGLLTFAERMTVVPWASAVEPDSKIVEAVRHEDQRAFRRWWGNDEQSDTARLCNACWYAALGYARQAVVLRLALEHKRQERAGRPAEALMAASLLAQFRSLT